MAEVTPSTPIDRAAEELRAEIAAERAEALLDAARPRARSRGLARFRARMRQLGLLVAAVLPQPFKRWVYRGCFGYRISARAQIGIAYLDCESLAVDEGSRISHGVVFLGCGHVTLGKHVHVGALNLFSGGRRIELGDYSHIRRLCFINAIRDHDCTNDPDSTFILGYGSVVTAEHRIDFTDRVEIGRCSILGGRNSSIWTHNIRVGKPVRIGNYCYVGSEVRIAPGAVIPDCCIVGLASVLTRPLAPSFSLIAGVPARVVRDLTEEDHLYIFGKTRRDLPDEEYPKPPGNRGGTEVSASGPEGSLAG